MNFQVRYLNLSIANEPFLHLHFDLLSCCVSAGSPAVFPVAFGCNALDEVVCIPYSQGRLQHEMELNETESDDPMNLNLRLDLPGR